MKVKNKKLKVKNYGDNPHVADFGPNITADDIKTCRREVTLTVGQKKITKSVPTTIRR